MRYYRQGLLNPEYYFLSLIIFPSGFFKNFKTQILTIPAHYTLHPSVSETVCSQKLYGFKKYLRNLKKKLINSIKVVILGCLERKAKLDIICIVSVIGPNKEQYFCCFIENYQSSFFERQRFSLVFGKGVLGSDFGWGTQVY